MKTKATVVAPSNQKEIKNHKTKERSPSQLKNRARISKNKMNPKLPTEDKK